MATALHLIEILLPKMKGDGAPIGRAYFEALLAELTERFGGATCFARTPAEGLWEDDGGVDHDDIAIIEVMTEALDEDYWRDLRRRLEADLQQDEIIVRARQVMKL
jgi:hypothetical protein